MTDYGSYIFNGRCPYTDEPCPEKISCVRCLANDREKALMEKMEEMERLEMLLTELEGEE